MGREATRGGFHLSSSMATFGPNCINQWTWIAWVEANPTPVFHVDAETNRWEPNNRWKLLLPSERVAPYVRPKHLSDFKLSQQEVFESVSQSEHQTWSQFKHTICLMGPALQNYKSTHMPRIEWDDTYENEKTHNACPWLSWIARHPAMILHNLPPPHIVINQNTVYGNHFIKWNS